MYLHVCHCFGDRTLTHPQDMKRLPSWDELSHVLFITLDLLALYVGVLIPTISEYSILTTFVTEDAWPSADNSEYV